MTSQKTNTKRWDCSLTTLKTKLRIILIKKRDASLHQNDIRSTRGGEQLA